MCVVFEIPVNCRTDDRRNNEIDELRNLTDKRINHHRRIHFQVGCSGCRKCIKITYGRCHHQERQSEKYDKIQVKLVILKPPFGLKGKYCFKHYWSDLRVTKYTSSS